MALLTRNERLMHSLEHLEAVRRATQTGSYSKQPRFGDRERDSFFNSVLIWTQSAMEAEPPYNKDSRKRDEWLSEFWKAEPHLAGVVNSVVNIDKNRAWSLTGGRNQVNRFTRILREAEAGQGWRYYMTQQSQSYYTTDLGAITEVGREGIGGPLRALYTLDPTLCRLTGNADTPLHYRNTKEPWQPEDFFRVVSMPSFKEKYNGLGFCALSRVLELAKLMIAVYEHDQEKLGATSPRGLLLLRGIEQEQWDEAMERRSAILSQREQQYYGGVSVLASRSENIEAKLVALSTLPDNFDIKVTTDLLMYAYALCFGYDAVEFWPISTGALGRGQETQIQHEKATGKGGSDFMLSYQDRLSMELPETLVFDFEQRDAQGMMLEASVVQAWADVANSLYQGGAGVLTQEQAASLLVSNGIIPAEWTETSEDSMASDTEYADENGGTSAAQARMRQLRAEAIENPRIQQAAQMYPHEPIVRVTWPTNKTTVLWHQGADALARAVWQVLPHAPRYLPEPAQRQADDEDGALFDDGVVVITEKDVDEALDEAADIDTELDQVLHARTLTDEEIAQLNEQEV